MNRNNPIAVFVRTQRKMARLTQAELAVHAGVGLRFVRDAEQGKESLRIDTLNKVLALFGHQTGPVRTGRTATGG